MSGIGGSEFILLCLIGLLILGPERLPKVARELGRWAGKARQMARSLQQQLEEETNLEKNLGFDPKELHPSQLMTPRDLSKIDLLQGKYAPMCDAAGNVLLAGEVRGNFVMDLAGMMNMPSAGGGEDVLVARLAP